MPLAKKGIWETQVTTNQPLFRCSACVDYAESSVYYVKPCEPYNKKRDKPMRLVVCITLVFATQYCTAKTNVQERYV